MTVSTTASAVAETSNVLLGRCGDLHVTERDMVWHTVMERTPCSLLLENPDFEIVRRVNSQEAAAQEKNREIPSDFIGPNPRLF